MSAHHELLILRHAKSSWDSDAATDFDRPLAARGIRDAERLSEWLAERELLPDRVLCSAARRAKETARLSLLPPVHAHIEHRDSLYHASLATLVNCAREQSEQVARLMLVGHNPGMDQLVAWLCKGQLTLTPRGKLMTTCALAQVRLSCPWAELEPRKCDLVTLRRPGDTHQ